MKLIEVFNRMTMARALLLGMGIALVYYLTLFNSGATQQAQIQQTQSDIQALQAKIKVSQEKIDRASVYQKTASEIGSTIAKLFSLIPEKFSLGDLMKIISNEVKVSGSSLVSLKPGEQQISKVAPEFEEILVSVDVTGTFLQHMVFLSNLTKVGQILILKKFDLASEPSTKPDDAMPIRFTADILAFRYRGSEAQKTPPPSEGG